MADRGILGPEALAHDARPQPAGGPELRHLLQQVRVRVEEERHPRGDLVDLQAGLAGGVQVGDAVAQGEGHLLDGVRARLADVVAADADAVPAGQLVPAERQDVGAQAHRRAGRIDVRPAGDVLLQDVVLDRARQALAGDAPLVGHRHVQRQQGGGGGVDGHGGRHLVQRQAVQQPAHVVQGGDGHAGAAHLARGQRVIRVAPHLGGQIEGHRQPGLPRGQQALEALVGGLGRAEAGVLAHGPQAAAVHGRLHAPGEGELPGRTPGRGPGRTAASGPARCWRRTDRRAVAPRATPGPPGAPPQISAPGPGFAGASAPDRGARRGWHRVRRCRRARGRTGRVLGIGAGHATIMRRTARRRKT